MTDDTALGRRPAVWGHRGASATHRENTIDAFVAAARMGADGIELDVRRLSDGGLAVHHDPGVPAPDGRALAAMTTGDLPPHIPLLADALTACLDAGLATVNVEIKNWSGDADHDPTEALADSVAAVVDALGCADHVIVSCFSPLTLARVAEVAPGLRRGQLASPRADQADALAAAVAAGHHAFHPHHLAVGVELVDTAHRAGLAVNTWTVDDPERIRWLAGIGVDAVITNVPDVALRALR